MLNEAIEKWTACFQAQPMGACHFDSTDAWLLAVLALITLFAVYAARKLIQTVLTFLALALLPALSRCLSKWVKSRDYAEEELLRADGAGEPWVNRRKQALDRLAVFLRTQNQRSVTWANSIRESFSDLRFTDANRVPFP
jgi:glutamate-1-semialdehyde 2,1-aminomutase